MDAANNRGEVENIKVTIFKPPGQKKPRLRLNGQEFYHKGDNKTNLKQRWSCAQQPKCPGIAHTDENGRLLIEESRLCAHVFVQNASVTKTVFQNPGAGSAAPMETHGRTAASVDVLSIEHHGKLQLTKDRRAPLKGYVHVDKTAVQFWGIPSNNLTSLEQLLRRKFSFKEFQYLQVVDEVAKFVIDFGTIEAACNVIANYNGFKLNNGEVKCTLFTQQFCESFFDVRECKQLGACQKYHEECSEDAYKESAITSGAFNQYVHALCTSNGFKVKNQIQTFDIYVADFGHVKDIPAPPTPVKTALERSPSPRTPSRRSSASPLLNDNGERVYGTSPGSRRRRQSPIIAARSSSVGSQGGQNRNRGKINQQQISADQYKGDTTFK